MYGYGRKSLECPVCKEPLGYLVKGQNNTFLCQECQWLYTWDYKGNLRPPVKYKPTPKGCDCGGCQFRESRSKD